MLEPWGKSRVRPWLWKAAAGLFAFDLIGLVVAIVLAAEDDTIMVWVWNAVATGLVAAALYLDQRR